MLAKAVVEGAFMKHFIGVFWIGFGLGSVIGGFDQCCFSVLGFRTLSEQHVASNEAEAVDAAAGFRQLSEMVTVHEYRFRWAQVLRMEMSYHCLSI